MSQWNNSYAYNSQYQTGNGWNGDPNNQFVNQPYYPNRQDPNNQYINFNEFLTQMQSNSVVPGTASQLRSVQFENYPPAHYGYQNIPSNSQNNQLENYTYGQSSSNLPNNTDMYHTNVQAQYMPPNHTHPNDLILKSNLTPTATEFVPKSKTAPITNSKQNAESTNMLNDAPEVSTKHSSSSGTNWRERPQTSKQNDEVACTDPHNHLQDNKRPQSNGRNRESSRDGQSNGLYYEASNRNYDRNQYESSNRSTDQTTRNYESSSRHEKRVQVKPNHKTKTKDSDVRTFYNSAINKDSQDVRNGRGECSTKLKNRVGSHRLRTIDRNKIEDEEFANNYLQSKEERIEKNKPELFSSPIRYRNKNTEQGQKEMTQRERLTEQLEKGSLECLVCCERVKQIDPVWSCGNCYHVLHLRCIRKWAISSMVEGKWRCPACQNSNNDSLADYRCMCGAVRSPEYQRGATLAHTCGKSCKRPRSCRHPCTLLCHPGPCPACQATVTKQCGCGTETRSVLCSSKLVQVCGRVCHRVLECGAHECLQDCHEGPCGPCTKSIDQVCYCPAAKTRSVACTNDTSGSTHWSCDSECGRVLSCGAHVCRQPCHPPPCQPCLLLPETVVACPCGKTRLEKDIRKSCVDPIPLCGNICAKPLTCGPPGDKHFCKVDCHTGPCPGCPDQTVLQCRCGHASREVPCSDLPQMYNNVLCQKKCNKKLSCGRHRCRTLCCSETVHRCTLVCARSLPCQTHRCEEFCHTGRCAPCPRLSFEELRCECGIEVILPPVACGTKPPACSAPCCRPRPCGHLPHHSCHSGDCPPCVVLTTKRCYGNHEERKTIPCSQEEFSCGLPCGKPLPCGKHTCIKTCHKGLCDTSKCTQSCNEKRASCGHACAAPCHFGAEPESSASLCPSTAPCRKPVRAICPCGRRSAERPCCENSRDYAKMMSALAATKIQEGGSVDLSDVQRPSNVLKTLECEEECRSEARARQLALALQIRNPDVSSKLAPRYSEHVRATATREPAFAIHVHDKLTDLVQLAKKSKQKTRAHSFPSMNWQKRQFIHEMCEHFGCESVAYDAEPNRNVVATADKEKSWLPAMSIMEVLAREAGKRRVPGPVLRSNITSGGGSAPASGSSSSATYASKSAGGWATLTSTNAWAARSKPAKLQTNDNKIDYFDNPPDN